ncbi:PD-(D/E)XK nuclease family protein [Brevibacterium jeotgali]|uniref:PD-(D/E)XK nuclease superfamily protein n=1 Tax=Brevibacterium jeotgali TaxID=1262550 RepID=A0A2H1L9W5_9MICO|nr:PD-(D/E)XK nuclease family protein [Brevibacterium jeotgali]TWC03507.1 PD-(D/E)XK nuclease superfamily protein [Brevibacterium jeotgali]SMY13253.1 PD-(D/E)XK nuclease superfamily protein [Brevibacterium jeotgali]
MEHDFNVFDVMHHGTHEKQLSNVFAWLLDVGGTHGLGDRFLRSFIDEVNAAQPGGAPFPRETYRVRQEVNTGIGPDDIDIADIVLTGETAALVVENYFTSDGHQHGYERYLAFGQRDARRGGVVMLCRDEDRSRLSDGWQQSIVVTYGALIDRLHSSVDGDTVYRSENPDAHSFIAQMHRKFVSEERRVSDRDVLGFVTAMCDSGEAERYGWRSQDQVAEAFASDLAAQGRQRYVEGSELLQRIKGRLRSFSNEILNRQLTSTFGDDHVGPSLVPYRGLYQWAVDFTVHHVGVDSPAPHVQLAFGPTAWFVNERLPGWTHTMEPGIADYSRVFVLRLDSKELLQTPVTLPEVLDGLGTADRRLHDAVVELLARRSSTLGE